MTLITTPTFDNQFLPGVTSYAYYPDQLIAGDHNLVPQPIVLGAGTLLRGTVLGQQSAFTIQTAATAGNVGNGTIGSVSPGAAPETNIGSATLPTYVIKATSPTAFTVTDPEGNNIGNATVGTPYTSNEVNFTLTAGGTAFATGDSFSLTYTAGLGTFIASVRTATDGSQIPSAILVDNADASAGPVRCGAYVSGEFNIRAVIADSSWTAALLSTAMRTFAINLKSSVSAADPS